MVAILVETHCMACFNRANVILILSRETNPMKKFSIFLIPVSAQIILENIPSLHSQQEKWASHECLMFICDIVDGPS